VGVLDHFEIWDRNRWDQENAALEEDMEMEDLKHQIAKLGL
jgi:DNA-binding transcriptional regulator/RsmH inhibitor MraZ